MITLDEFYDEYNYSALPMKIHPNDSVRIFPTLTNTGDCIFGYNIGIKDTCLFLNMQKPEIYAAESMNFDKSDIDLLMHLLVDEGIWTEMIDVMKNHMENFPDECVYDLSGIPDTPPDYTKILEE